MTERPSFARITFKFDLDIFRLSEVIGKQFVRGSDSVSVARARRVELLKHFFAHLLA